MDVDNDMCRLPRLLCTSQKFDDDLKKLITDLVLKGRGSYIVNKISEFATSHAVAKSDILLNSLAYCVTLQGGTLRQNVYSLVPKICRTPTDLFKFLTFEASFTPNKKGSFGRSKRRLVAQWYNVEVKSAKQLAVLLTKYKRRSGWTHADVLRLAHVKPVNEVRGLLFRYALKGFEDLNENCKVDSLDEALRAEAQSILDYLEVIEIVRHSRDEDQVAELVTKHDLLHQHVPTWMSHSKLVWRALLEKMPLLATIKNLGRVSSVGLLDAANQDSCVQVVKRRLEDGEHLKQAKIHPFTILIAWKTYESGHGDRGSLKWKPNPQIVAALSNAFNLSFRVISPTNKRYLLAIDCCESMTIGGVMDTPSVSPLLASAAMAIALSYKEPSSQIVVLSSGVEQLSNIPSQPTLDGLYKLLSKKVGRGSGSTDCSCPMTWAKERKQPVDVFVVYTCQNGQGSAKTPVQALKEYRTEMKLPYTRLVVVALTSAVKCQDPSEFDVGTIYLSGFDASIHEIIQSFVLGQLDAPPGG